MINSHNILFKNCVTNSKEAFIYEEIHSIDKILFSETSSSSSLRSPIDVLEKSVRFLTSNLKTKVITSEDTFRKRLCGMVVYQVLKSKVEIDLEFCLTLILFSLATIKKEFWGTWNFLHPKQKKRLLNIFYRMKRIIIRIIRNCYLSFCFYISRYHNQG